MKLRDYQKTCKNEIQSNWEAGIRRQMAVMPTGSGKTVLFAILSDEFIRKDQKVLVVAHREELITQAVNKLAIATGTTPGIIKPGYKPNPDAVIQVASIQTLARRKKYPDADLIIVDEAHHAASISYRKLLENYPDAKILGVTATPQRIDGYGFSDLFDKLVVGATVGQLIAEGYLCQFKMIGGFAKLGLFAPVGRDFTAKELERAATKIKPEDVMKCWYEFCFGKKTVIFATNVAHSEAIALHFQSKGLAAEHIDGETPTTERKAILERFRTGETLIISNCSILIEGYDCPDIEAIQCARPTTSLGLWLQMLGRSLRPSPLKEHAILIDQTDNWYRLDLPDKPRQWSLDPQPADEEAPGIRHCTKCHHIFKPMEALVTEKFVWSEKDESFKTLLTTPCPSCGREVNWQLGSGLGQDFDQEESKKDFDLEVEYREIPPECQFEILKMIGNIRKSGSRFKNIKNRERKFYKSLKELIQKQHTIQIAEIELAIEILQVETSLSDIVEDALTNAMICSTERKNWVEIETLMKDRPQNIKRLVWDMLHNYLKNKVRKIKKEYEIQLILPTG